MATLLRDTALPTDTDATDTGGDALRCAARLCQQMRAACVTTAAASLWAGYGLLIHSLPVIVSNLIVISMALATARRRPREPRGRT